jgi:hypothetical protein
VTVTTGNRWGLQFKPCWLPLIKAPLLNSDPVMVSKEIQYLNLGETCGLDGIPHEYLWHLPRKPLVHLTYLFNHCFRFSHFPAPWKEVKTIILPKPGKDPKFPPNFRPISLLSTTGKLFEKPILRTIQKTLRKETYGI